MEITIVGAGQMGRGIAQVGLLNGYSINLVDIDPKVLDEAREEIERRIAKSIVKNRIELESVDNVISDLKTHLSWEDCIRRTDLVIEAVPEDKNLKQDLISAIHEGKDCIVASNTSSIAISELASSSQHPQKIVGMHFFNPPPVMKLVEIIVGPQTSKQTLEVVTDVAKDMGKEPIQVRDSPGFASSRLGVALGLEAIRMLEQDVASPDDIDKAMTLGYRHPMGPLELTDYIGLDTRLKIAEYLNSTGISPAFKIPNLLKEMVEKGKLGRKSGEGFYNWEGGKKK